MSGRSATYGDGSGTLADAEGPAGTAAPRLEGRMGVAELVFTVLAFNGPLAAVAGYLAFIIYFNGVGAPIMLVMAGIITLIFAVGLTTMGRYLPNPGAFYAYITAGLGRALGLGGAFLAVLAYGLSLVGVYAFFGIVSDQLVMNIFSGPHIDWYWYALIAWAVVSLMSYRNIAVSARVLLFALGAEVIMVLIFDAVVLVNGGPEGRSLEPFSLSTIGGENVGVALLFSISLFLGFEATAIFREEAKRPLTTIPRATYTAVLTIIVLYVLTSWLLVTAFGVDEAAAIAQEDPAGMFLIAMEQYVGQVGVDVVSVLLVSSVFAALLSISNVLSRYLFSLGKDGVLPRVLGRAHPRFTSPYISAVAVSVAVLVVGAILVLSNGDASQLYASLAGVGGFGVIILEMITSIAVFAFFRRSGPIADTTRWHTAIAPVLATLGLAFIVFLAMSNFTTLTGASESLAVILQIVVWGVFASGIVVALVYRKIRPAVYESIGRQKL